MKPEERYVEEVMRHVFAPAEDRERFAQDLRSHFAEGRAEGQTYGDIVAGLGSELEVATAFNAERTFAFAGFWRRFFAFVADVGLLAVVTLPVLALGLVTGVVGEEPDGPAFVWFATVVLIALAIGGVYIFYFPLLESHYGRTLGKRLLRIRVVREDGSRIGLGQAFVRRLSMYFDMLWIDALFIPFTEKKQRALDVIAKTVVAKEPGEETPAWAYVASLLMLLVPFACLLALALTFS